MQRLTPEELAAWQKPGATKIIYLYPWKEYHRKMKSTERVTVEEFEAAYLHNEGIPPKLRELYITEFRKTVSYSFTHLAIELHNLRVSIYLAFFSGKRRQWIIGIVLYILWTLFCFVIWPAVANADPMSVDGPAVIVPVYPGDSKEVIEIRGKLYQAVAAIKEKRALGAVMTNRRGDDEIGLLCAGMVCR